MIQQIYVRLIKALVIMNVTYWNLVDILVYADQRDDETSSPNNVGIFVDLDNEQGNFCSSMILNAYDDPYNLIDNLVDNY